MSSMIHRYNQRKRSKSDPNSLSVVIFLSPLSPSGTSFNPVPHNFVSLVFLWQTVEKCRLFKFFFLFTRYRLIRFSV